MPEIEQQLRRRLSQQADRFTPTPGFTDRVRYDVARSRRLRLRRGLVVAAAAAIVGLAAVALAPVLDGESGRESDEQIVVEPGPATSAPTTATTAPPRPVPTTDPIALNEGWRLLDPGPLSGREGFGTVWTGTELIVWGGARVESRITNDEGAAYDPATGRWRMLAPAPIRSRSIHFMLWTGREVIVLAGSDFRGPIRDGAAYDPATDSWRVLAVPPIALEHEKTALVWTGEEVVAVGREAAAYEPLTDRWRRLPAPPDRFDFTQAIWSGREVLLVGGTIINNDAVTNARSDVVLNAYDPSSGAWRRAPASGFSGQGVDFAWNGRSLIGLSYTPDWTTIYDPGADTWRAGPDWPGAACEGDPSLASLGDGRLIGAHCGAVAIFDGDRWDPVNPPVEGSPTLPATMLAADGVVLWFTPGIPAGTPNFGSGAPATLLAYDP